MNEIAYIAPWIVIAIAAFFWPKKKHVNLDSSTVITLMVLGERKSGK